MVAYYAHSHGNGHLNTARLFCNAVYKDTLIITSKDSLTAKTHEIVQIENEDTLPVNYEKALFNLPQYAHYLPKSNKKIVKRTKQILDLITKHNITLGLIDVSVETAIIFRVSSIPYGYYLLPGHRHDLPHIMAFNAADFLYSFFPEVMFKSLPEVIKNKCFFLGFYSRFNFSTKFCIVEKEPSLNGKSILVICGNGGTNLSVTMMHELIELVPMCTLHSVGNIAESNVDGNPFHLGYVEDLAEIIKTHDIIISSCGMNLTSEILSIKNKFIAFAEDRPFEEQLFIQKALVENNLAVPFDANSFVNCLKSYLKLRPPNDLQDWFMSTNDARKFKEKINSYEKPRHILNNNIPQEVRTFAKIP